MLKGFHHRGISRPLTARVRTNPYTIWWDLSAQNPEMRVKNRLLDCPSEPPIRLERMTYALQKRCTTTVLRRHKVCWLRFQRKHFVLAVLWWVVPPASFHVFRFPFINRCARNYLLTRFTGFVCIAPSSRYWERFVKVFFFGDGNWLSNWFVLHLFSCLSLMYPAMRMT